MKACYNMAYYGHMCIFHVDAWSGSMQVLKGASLLLELDYRSCGKDSLVPST